MYAIVNSRPFTVAADTDPTTLPRIVATVALFSLVPVTFHSNVGREMTISRELAGANDLQIDLLTRKLSQMSLVHSVRAR